MGGSMMPQQGGYGAMPMGHHGADPRFSPYGAMPQPQPGYGAPAPQYGMPALPPGWEQATDPATGRPYYANRSTGETSWTPPTPPPQNFGPPPLPPGWEEARDPTSGKP